MLVQDNGPPLASGFGRAFTCCQCLRPLLQSLQWFRIPFTLEGIQQNSTFVTNAALFHNATRTIACALATQRGAAHERPATQLNAHHTHVTCNAWPVERADRQGAR